MIKFPATLLLLVLLCCTLTGCGLRRPEPARASFAFAPDFPDRPVPENGPVLAVRMLDAAPEFENRFFVYQVGDSRWESDFFHVFDGSPGSQITSVTRRWLSKSGIFQAIAIPGLAPGNSWLLQGYISELFGDFRDRTAPSAVLSLRFTLLAPGATAASNSIFSKHYSRRIPLSERSPEGLLKAWDRALEEILSELASDLRRIKWSSPPVPKKPPKLLNLLEPATAP